MTPQSQPAALNQEKRTRILDIAKRRMMHYGVSKTTMSDIAEEAQMAVGTLYLHFRNKDEMVLAIAQECREEQDAFLQSILHNQELSPSQKLETFLLEKFRYINTFRTETPHGKELIHYLIQTFPESISDWQQRFENAVGEILRQGVEQGHFSVENIPHTAKLLRLATLGFFPPPYIEFPKTPEEEELLDLIGWFMQWWKV